MNKKLIVAVLALGLFVAAGGRALAGPTVDSDVLFVGPSLFGMPEDLPGVPQVIVLPSALLIPDVLQPGLAVQLYQDASFQVLSDQIYTVQNAHGGSDLIARSDPDLVTLDPTVFHILNVAETGLPQDFSSFFNGQVGFQSDLNVPEPATLALLGIGALGMAGYGWRKRKTAAA